MSRFAFWTLAGALVSEVVGRTAAQLAALYEGKASQTALNLAHAFEIDRSDSHSWAAVAALALAGLLVLQKRLADGAWPTSRLTFTRILLTTTLVYLLLAPNEVADVAAQKLAGFAEVIYATRDFDSVHGLEPVAVEAAHLAQDGIPNPVCAPNSAFKPGRPIGFCGLSHQLQAAPLLGYASWGIKVSDYRPQLTFIASRQGLPILRAQLVQRRVSRRTAVLCMDHPPLELEIGSQMTLTCKRDEWHAEWLWVELTCANVIDLTGHPTCVPAATPSEPDMALAPSTTALEQPKR